MDDLDTVFLLSYGNRFGKRTDRQRKEKNRNSRQAQWFPLLLYLRMKASYNAEALATRHPTGNT